MNPSSPLEAAHRQAGSLWLHHPVLGDPSFDTFQRAACNPIHSGYPRFEWPVNEIKDKLTTLGLSLGMKFEQGLLEAPKEDTTKTEN